eukprot:gene10983-3689_t
MKLVNEVMKFFRQTLALYQKEFILSYRKYITTAFMLLLFPLMFLVLSLFTLVDLPILQPPTIPPEIMSPKINRCDTFDCKTIAYSPVGNEDVDKLMKLVLQRNGLSEDDYRSFQNEKLLFSHLLNNTDSSAAVHFSIKENNGVKIVDYKIYYQKPTPSAFTSGEDFNPATALQNSIDSAIAQHFLNKNIDIKMSKKSFPSRSAAYLPPPQQIRTIQTAIINIAGGSFMFVLFISINWILYLYRIQYEKENLLRFASNLMGMKTFSYWFSSLSFQYAINLISFLITYVIGLIADVHFFRYTHPVIVLLIFSIVILFCLLSSILTSILIQNLKLSIILAVLWNFVSLLGFYIGFIPRILIFEPLFLLSPSYNIGKLISEIQIYQFASILNPNVKEIRFYGLEKFGEELPPSIPIYGFPEISITLYSWTPLVFLVCQMILMTLFIWYFDSVLTSDNGVGRPFQFFLTPSYWFGSKKRITPKVFDQQGQSLTVSDDTLRESQSTYDADENNTLRVFGIEKTFNSLFKQSVRAVRGVNLTGEKGSCISLLGHNGAGKTTLIGILTGRISPSFGDASVFGYSIRENMEDIKNFIGLCSQSNILWDNLTVYEHLRLFCYFKNVPWNEMNSKIESILKQIHLEDSRNKYSSSLSGGMKRRLCLGMSLIGDPEIVFLDEPTTGLDPQSKRQVWQMIEDLKKDKLVILTTHSMEEADALADKIIIMGNGEVKCSGNPLELKTKYGGGYTVSIVFDPKHQQDVTGFIQQHELEHTISDENKSGNIILKIPSGNYSLKQLTPFLSTLENELETEEKSGIIKDYSMSLTSLQDVFISITEESNKKEDYIIQQQMINNHDEFKVLDDENDDTFDQQSIPKTNSIILLYLSQLKALLFKSGETSKRRICFFACQFIAPFLTILIGLALGFYVSSQMYNFSPPAAPVPNPNYHLDIPYEFNHQQEHVSNRLFIPTSGFPEFVGNLTKNNKTQNSGIFIGFPQHYRKRGSFSINATREYAYWPYSVRFDTPNDFDIAYMSDRSFNSETSIAAIHLKSKSENHLNYMIQYPHSPFISGNVCYFTGHFNQRFFMDCNVLTVSTYMNLVTHHYFSEISNNQLKVNAKIQNYPSRFIPTITPTGLGELDNIFESGIFLFALTLMLPFPLIIFNISYERQEGTYEMMQVMGMKMSIYWSFWFIMNSFLYISVVIIALIIGLIFQLDFILKSNPFTWIVLFILWGLSINSMSIFFSSLISSPVVSIVVAYMILGGSFLFIVPHFFINLSLGVQIDTFGASILWTIYDRVGFPTYHFQDALNKGIIFKCLGKKCPEFFDMFSGSDLTIGYLSLIFDIFFYAILGFLIDRFYSGKNSSLNVYIFSPISRLIKKLFKIDHLPIDENEDEDVKKEREISFETTGTSENILLRNVSKKYKEFVVTNLSLQWSQGETLGLLGPNGAGKTTTMKIMCGLEDQTSGDLIINGYNSNTQISKIQQNLGYSPQLPILFKDLSVLGHLLFYSRLKGIPKKFEMKNAMNILKFVKLDSLSGSNSIATKLSGGMQQRLSLAISLIGNPKSVILDEPTSGLDPYTKREMWKLISDLKKQKCVLLSTHSLEEADVLCDRIGIMSKGKLQCIGSPIHLKNKFGNKYHLMINCEKTKVNSVKDYIISILPSSKIGRSFGGNLIFSIDKSDMKIIDLIHEIEDHKKENGIDEWAVSDTTLEDVFMNIVNIDE